MAERLCAEGGGVTVEASGALEADRREGSREVRIVSKSPVYLHGMRPVDAPGAPGLAHLSLYELLRYWRI
eukprot:9016059-Pyramimonas_sp.AAC.1